MELPKRQETIVSRCTRRGDSGHRLNELQRQVRAAAISADPRDRDGPLTLLPRSLCASTGHYPHTRPREPAQHATARVPWSRDNFPGRTHGATQAVAVSCCPLPLQARPTFQLWILYPSLSPAWVSKRALISLCFNPLLSGWGTDALRWPTHRGGAKSKAEPQELCEQRREREISPSSLRSSGLSPHNQLDVPASVEYLNRQRITPKLRWWALGATVDLGFAVSASDVFLVLCLS